MRSARNEDRTALEWCRDNKDVWRTRRRPKVEWGGGRLVIYKVKAHADERDSDSCMTLHEVHNIKEDKRAEVAYRYKQGRGSETGGST